MAFIVVVVLTDEEHLWLLIVRKVIFSSMRPKKLAPWPSVPPTNKLAIKLISKQTKADKSIQNHTKADKIIKIEVIYDNTDQKDTTRLGEVWEWSTKVTVTRYFQQHGGEVGDMGDVADVQAMVNEMNNLRW